jgi:peptidoglycan/LPS O-acetylase OafA/YrhL
MRATTGTLKTATGHLAYLDGLRGLAALQVLLGHATLQIQWEADSPSKFAHALIWPFSFGREAVALFIVLSGFCLMLPIVRNGGALQGGAMRFFKRRARRILPPYYFALGLSLLLIGIIIGQKTHTHWDVTLPVTEKAIWSHLLLVHNLFTDTASRINHVMWSIAVEWQIYFLFPLLVILWKNVGGAISTQIVLVSSYMLVRWLHFSWLNTGAYGVCPQFVGLFAMGMFGAEMAYSNDARLVRVRNAISWAVVVIVLLAAVLLARAVNFRQAGGLPWYLKDYVLGMFAMSLMVFVAVRSGALISRFLAWKPVAFLGTFGYSLYLMHAPFLQVVTQYVIQPLKLAPIPSFLLLLGLGVPVIVALCYGFYLLCERPFLNAPAKVGNSRRVYPADEPHILSLGVSGK